MLEQFQKDLIKAMKEQDKEKLSVLRMVKAAMDKERIDKKKELNDELLTDVVCKEIKMLKDSIIEFEKGARPDLVEKSKNELEILKAYLQDELTEEEVDAIIKEAITRIKPTSLKDMGKIIKEITPQVKGRYDMAEVSAKVRARITEDD